MATCMDDCLYYTVCSDFRGNICETDLNRFMEYRGTSDGLCEHFKNKADVAEVKWIPVTERLPKGRRKYLCICVFGESKMQFCDVLMFHPEQNAENGYVTGPHFSNEGVGDMRVTHWMPLPKPPSGAKMDGKENM